MLIEAKQDKLKTTETQSKAKKCRIYDWLDVQHWTDWPSTYINYTR